MMKYSTPLFQMKVLVDDKPIQEYHKDSRTYVEGRKGSRFSLELTNLTGRRILAHPTVDGLSVMTGKEASRNDNTDGYVLMPHQRLVIPGWRLNNETVADFFFAGGGGSYAEKSGKPRNRGVIGCAVWEQKQQPVFIGFMSTGDQGTYRDAAPGEWDPSFNDMAFDDEEPCSGGMQPSRCSMDNMKSSRGAWNQVTRSAQNLGAGFGDRSTHQVHEVTFSPASDEPVLIAAIYYDDYEGLRSKGLKLPKRQRHVRPSMPDPFPKSQGCKPPAGWRG